MAKRTYRTASGKMVDMDTLALKNETVIAVGNMNVNARGDKLGNGGRIVKSREELIASHYKVKGNTVPQEKPLPSAKQQPTRVIDEDPAGPMDAPAEPDSEQVNDPLDVYDDNQQDAESTDEWIEDPETGDFVKATEVTAEKPTTKGIAGALAGTKSVSVPFEESQKQKARKTRGVKRI
jgi:hypothetical protein